VIPIYFQRQGDLSIDRRGPADYVSAVANGDMDDAENDDAGGTAGSPVLLKSLGNKRDWEDKLPNVRNGNTVCRPLCTTFH
jgi:hypothetical protein